MTHIQPQATLEAYAPFILRSSRTRKRFEVPKAYPHPYRCWTLIEVEEHGFTMENRVTTTRVEEGQILFLPPAFRGNLRPRSSTKVRTLEFDLIHRDRCWAGTRGWVPASDSAPRQGFSYLFGTSAPRMLPQKLSEQLHPLIKDITDRWWGGGLDMVHANARLGIIISRILEWHLSPDHDLESLHPLLPAETAARNGFSHGFTVADMAGQVGMTREGFSMAYKEWRGVSPGGFLRDLRYQRAKELLQDPELSLERVAKASGFRSVRSFRAGFEKREGLSPQEWRQDFCVSNDCKTKP